MFEKIVQNTETPERKATSEGNFYATHINPVSPGMNERIQQLRKLSVETEPTLSIERAIHETAFYKENFGKISTPVLRAANFLDHCKKKSIYLGKESNNSKSVFCFIQLWTPKTIIFIIFLGIVLF